MLNRMMELYDDKRVGSGWSYNEIVIDPAHMAIEAVIYGSQLQPGDVSAADVHSRTLDYFGLKANQLPLLQFDAVKGFF